MDVVPTVFVRRSAAREACGVSERQFRRLVRAGEVRRYWVHGRGRALYLLEDCLRVSQRVRGANGDGKE